VAVIKLHAQLHFQKVQLCCFDEFLNFWQIYSNWKQLLVVAQEVSSSYSQDKLVFLVPLVTALEPGLFIEALLDALWQPHALRLHVENVR